MPPEKRKMLRNIVLSASIMLLITLLLYDNNALYYKRQESRAGLLFTVYLIAWIFTLTAMISIAVFFYRDRKIVYTLLFPFTSLGCLTSEFLFIINAISLHSFFGAPWIYIVQFFLNVLLGVFMLILFFQQIFQKEKLQQS